MAAIMFESEAYDIGPPQKMSRRGKFLYLVMALFYVMSANLFCADNVKSTGKHWKLNSYGDKVVSISGNGFGLESGKYKNSSMLLEYIRFEQDKIFQTLLSTNMKNGVWTKRETISYCNAESLHCTENLKREVMKESKLHLTRNDSGSAPSPPEPPLDCGKAVNFTQFDHLVGVSQRDRHPPAPEPHAALLLLLRRQGDSAAGGPDSADLDQWERRLRRSRHEKPKSLQLYNQIGNFWRIKGDASKAIECFRRSLAVSPNNAEVLLSLARVLFNLQYLDDAIFLTRRSLEVQPPDQNAWLHHFTLGEILKEYGSYQEAELHLRRALELQPQFPPAEAALLQLRHTPGARLHACTAGIIFLLVFAVLFFMASTVEPSGSTEAAADGCRSSRSAGARTPRGRCRRSV